MLCATDSSYYRAELELLVAMVAVYMWFKVSDQYMDSTSPPLT